MHTQMTMMLRPAKDIQLDAINDMPLQSPVKLVEIEARLKIHLAIKRIHRKRIAVILVGRARSNIAANYRFACFLGTDRQLFDPCTKSNSPL